MRSSGPTHSTPIIAGESSNTAPAGRTESFIGTARNRTVVGASGLCEILGRVAPPRPTHAAGRERAGEALKLARLYVELIPADPSRPGEHLGSTGVDSRIGKVRDAIRGKTNLSSNLTDAVNRELLSNPEIRARTGSIDRLVTGLVNPRQKPQMEVAAQAGQPVPSQQIDEWARATGYTDATIASMLNNPGRVVTANRFNDWRVGNIKPSAQMMEFLRLNPAHRFGQRVLGSPLLPTTSGPDDDIVPMALHTQDAKAEPRLLPPLAAPLPAEPNLRGRRPGRPKRVPPLSRSAHAGTPLAAAAPRLPIGTGVYDLQPSPLMAPPTQFNEFAAMLPPQVFGYGNPQPATHPPRPTSPSMQGMGWAPMPTSQPRPLPPVPAHQTLQEAAARSAARSGLPPPRVHVMAVGTEALKRFVEEKFSDRVVGLTDRARTREMARLLMHFCYPEIANARGRRATKSRLDTSARLQQNIAGTAPMSVETARRVTAYRRLTLPGEIIPDMESTRVPPRGRTAAALRDLILPSPGLVAPAGQPPANTLSQSPDRVSPPHDDYKLNMEIDDPWAALE